MRSFRSKPVGWRYESHKHSLAAKGIRSKYFADSAPDKYDKVADFLHAAADDGRAKVPDFHEQHRQDMVNGVVKQYSDEFSQGESAGVFRAGVTKSFLQDDLTNECKDFIDEKIDEQTFKSNLARRAAKHKQQHSATLDVWGSMEGRGPENDHNAGAFMPEILQDAKPAVYLAKKSDDQKKYDAYVKEIELWGVDRPDISRNAAFEAGKLESSNSDIVKSDLVGRWKKEDLNKYGMKLRGDAE